MAIRIRAYEPADTSFILSLITRFSEFELPAWRKPGDVDRTDRLALHQAMEELEPGSAIVIVEEEFRSTLAGFVHCQTQRDYFDGKKQGHISDLAVAKSFEGRESDASC